MRLFFIGDVVGSGGCDFLAERLPVYKKFNAIDLCVVNGENSAQGNGATPRSCEQLLNAGADLITLGNHTYKRPEIAEYLDSSAPVVRPYNFPAGDPGRGVAVIDKGAYRVAVVNLLGTVYSEPVGNPFFEIDRALRETADCKAVFVDFHAEATAEKRALGFYLDGRVTAVFGTHTHVQTADEQLLPNGTAYITDVGMTGPVQSVLGIEPELAIRKMKTNMPVRFQNAGGEYALDGCVVDFNEKTGRANSIERVVLL